MRPDPISKDPPQRWSKADWEFITEQLEDAIAAFVPRLSHDQIRAVFEERLAQAERDYQDFLSMPDA